MRGTSSRSLAAFVTAFWLAGPASADPTGLGGDWVFHVDWGQLKYDMFCHFVDDAGKLTAVCQGFSGDMLRTRGVIDATSLKLSYSTHFMQYDVSVEYLGTRDASGGASGSIRAGNTMGDFYGSAPMTLGDQTLAWSLHSSLPGVKPYDLFCSLAPDGKVLSGRCVAAGGPVMQPAGTLAGTAVSFSYMTGQTRAQFTGTFDGDDRIAGTGTSDIGGSATFTAKRY